MKRTSLFLGVGAVFVLAACTQTPPETTEPDAAEVAAIEAEAAAAVEAQVDGLLEAFNAGDAAALGATYAEDLIQMPPDGPLVDGRTANVQAWEDYLAEFSAHQTATVDAVEVLGQVALARGTWHVRQTPVAGGDEQERNGKWMVLYQRQGDGVWLAWRWMWNEEGAAADEM